MNERRELTERFWETVEPSLEGYSKALGILLREVEIYKLKEIVRNMEDVADEDDE